MQPRLPGANPGTLLLSRSVRRTPYYGYTFREYLELEADANVKHEFYADAGLESDAALEPPPEFLSMVTWPGTPRRSLRRRASARAWARRDAEGFAALRAPCVTINSTFSEKTRASLPSPWRGATPGE